MSDEWRLEDFQLNNNRIGQGTSATVFKAFHTPTQKFFALKFVT